MKKLRYVIVALALAIPGYAVASHFLVTGSSDHCPSCPRCP